VSRGQQSAAIEVVSALQKWPRMNSLTALDILLWTGQHGKALPWAENFLRRFSDLDLIVDRYPLPDDTVPAFRVLRHHGHPEADRISKLLAQRYASLQPDKARVFTELFSGLSWHTLQGNTEQALVWLAAAQQRGLIIPELIVDSLFEDLRDLPQTVEILDRMKKRAETLHGDLEAMVDC
jgi:hypothetical protein